MADKLRKQKYHHCHLVSHIAQVAERFLFTFTTTVEPRYNEHLYKEVLGIMNDSLCPSNGKIYEKEPCYSEHILPFPWPFIKSRFHTIAE